MQGIGFLAAWARSFFSASPATAEAEGAGKGTARPPTPTPPILRDNATRRDRVLADLSLSKNHETPRLLSEHFGDLAQHLREDYTKENGRIRVRWIKKGMKALPPSGLMRAHLQFHRPPTQKVMGEALGSGIDGQQRVAPLIADFGKASFARVSKLAVQPYVKNAEALLKALIAGVATLEEKHGRHDAAAGEQLRAKLHQLALNLQETRLGAEGNYFNRDVAREAFAKACSRQPAGPLRRAVEWLETTPAGQAAERNMRGIIPKRLFPAPGDMVDTLRSALTHNLICGSLNDLAENLPDPQPWIEFDEGRKIAEVKYMALAMDWSQAFERLWSPDPAMGATELRLKQNQQTLNEAFNGAHRHLAGVLGSCSTTRIFEMLDLLKRITGEPPAALSHEARKRFEHALTPARTNRAQPLGPDASEKLAKGRKDGISPVTAPREGLLDRLGHSADELHQRPLAMLPAGAERADEAEARALKLCRYAGEISTLAAYAALLNDDGAVNAVEEARQSCLPLLRDLDNTAAELDAGIINRILDAAQLLGASAPAGFEGVPLMLSSLARHLDIETALAQPVSPPALPEPAQASWREQREARRADALVPITRSLGDLAETVAIQGVDVLQEAWAAMTAPARETISESFRRGPLNGLHDALARGFDSGAHLFESTADLLRGLDDSMSLLRELADLDDDFEPMPMDERFCEPLLEEFGFLPPYETSDFLSPHPLTEPESMTTAHRAIGQFAPAVPLTDNRGKAMPGSLGQHVGAPTSATRRIERIRKQAPAASPAASPPSSPASSPTVVRRPAAGFAAPARAGTTTPSRLAPIFGAPRAPTAPPAGRPLGEFARMSEWERQSLLASLARRFKDRSSSDQAAPPLSTLELALLAMYSGNQGTGMGAVSLGVNRRDVNQQVKASSKALLGSEKADTLDLGSRFVVDSELETVRPLMRRVQLPPVVAIAIVPGSDNESNEQLKDFLDLDAPLLVPRAAMLNVREDHFMLAVLEPALAPAGKPRLTIVDTDARAGRRASPAEVRSTRAAAPRELAGVDDAALTRALSEDSPIPARRNEIDRALQAILGARHGDLELRTVGEDLQSQGLPNACGPLSSLLLQRFDGARDGRSFEEHARAYLSDLQSRELADRQAEVNLERARMIAQA